MVKITLNTQGIGELLKSQEVAASIREEAKKVQARAGDGYELSEKIGNERALCAVVADSIHARRSNAKNNTLLRAIGK